MDVKNIQKYPKTIVQQKIIPFQFDNPWVIIHVTFQCSAFPATRPVPSVATWRCRYPVPWSCGLNGGLSRRGDGRNKNDERWMQNKDEKRQVYSTRHAFWFELSGIIFPATSSHPSNPSFPGKVLSLLVGRTPNAVANLAAHGTMCLGIKQTHRRFVQRTRTQPH